MQKVMIRLMAGAVGVVFCLAAGAGVYRAYERGAWGLACVQGLGGAIGLWLLRIASTGTVFGRPVDARR